MFDTSLIGEVIETQGRVVTEKLVEDFLSATGSEFCEGVPPTFPTVFRKPEFEWLDRLGVDMKQLLHTDQEYEFRAPMISGEGPTIRTRLIEIRERKMLTLFVLEGEIMFGGEVSVTSRTTFVVRNGNAE